MGRAQFDKDQVIDAATELFWQQGYQAASMQNLVQCTGLKPGSLYLAFGNKEGLFAETLEAYGARGCERIEKRLAGAESVGEEICVILQGMVEEAVNKDYCSCFLVKAQLELATEGENHSELLQLVQTKLGEVEAVYAEAIGREFGSERGALLASSLMLHIFGLRVYGCGNQTREQMLKTLQQGLPWLPWQYSAEK